jgi:hypothetical protein
MMVTAISTLLQEFPPVYYSPEAPDGTGLVGQRPDDHQNTQDLDQTANE